MTWLVPSVLPSSTTISSYVQPASRSDASTRRTSSGRFAASLSVGTMIESAGVTAEIAKTQWRNEDAKVDRGAGSSRTPPCILLPLLGLCDFAALRSESLRHRQIRLDQCPALELLHAHRIHLHLKTGHVVILAILQPERPAVHRAHRAGRPTHVLDMPARQRAPRVRAGIVQHVRPSLVKENRQLSAVDVHVMAGALAQ